MLRLCAADEPDQADFSAKPVKSALSRRSARRSLQSHFLEAHFLEVRLLYLCLNLCWVADLSGGAFQKDDQNTYDAQKAKFDADRDFAMQQYNSYNAGILGRAPQTAGTVRANLVDPTAAAMGGAYAGSGIGQKMGNAFGSFFNQSPSVSVAGTNGPNTGFNFGGRGNRSPYLYGDGYGGGD